MVVQDDSASEAEWEEVDFIRDQAESFTSEAMDLTSHIHRSAELGNFLSEDGHKKAQTTTHHISLIMTMKSSLN